MGDIADMMLDGTMCQVCGDYMGDSGGFAVTCAGCGGNDWEKPEPKEKIKCPQCNKHVCPSGLKQHIQAKHGV